jgi:hypothetical protein
MKTGMKMAAWRSVAASAALLVVTTGAAAAQVSTLKAGVVVSRLTGSGATYWDESLVAQTIGLGLRWHFGRIALQPEVIYATRGAGASAAAETEQMRMDHLEVPVLVWVPVAVGPLEVFAFGGPSVMLETRCRHLRREQGLRLTVDCDPPFPPVFGRPAFDFAAVGGAGASHRLGGGRLSLEARYTHGLRNIYDGPDDLEAFNRSWNVMVGYSMSP